KPLKYPTIFNSADLTVVTKIDLAAAAEYDRTAAYRSIQSVRPGMEILEVSAKTGQGMDVWEAVVQAWANKSPAAAPGTSANSVST
ncbi:MAG: hypothetical protein KDA60_17985, partial [Planctomycetales bacterium]|nr:hypothetical protein [Planctomycetales bacterium]